MALRRVIRAAIGVPAAAAADATDPQVADRAAAAVWGFGRLLMVRRAGRPCEVPALA